MVLLGAAWSPRVGVVGLKMDFTWRSGVAGWAWTWWRDVTSIRNAVLTRRANCRAQSSPTDGRSYSNSISTAWYLPTTSTRTHHWRWRFSNAACTSENEGRRLIKAAELSTATYSFAENYVAHPHMRAIRESVDTGEVGRVELIEADYLHGMSPDMVAALVKDPAHWRGRIAPTAYCTHTVSPMLAVTGARPVEVTAFTVNDADPRAAVVLVVRLSTGALAVSRHGFLQGEPDSHWSWMSVRGTRGLAESVRGPGERAWSVRVRTEAWATANGQTTDDERTPPPLVLAGEAVQRAAEGTALSSRRFAPASRTATHHWFRCGRPSPPPSSASWQRRR